MLHNIAKKAHSHPMGNQDFNQEAVIQYKF